MCGGAEGLTQTKVTAKGHLRDLQAYGSRNPFIYNVISLLCFCLGLTDMSPTGSCVWWYLLGRLWILCITQPN